MCCVVTNKAGDQAELSLKFTGGNLLKCNGTAVREAKRVLPDDSPFKVYWTHVSL